MNRHIKIDPTKTFPTTLPDGTVEYRNPALLSYINSKGKVFYFNNTETRAYIKSSTYEIVGYNEKGQQVTSTMSFSSLFCRMFGIVKHIQSNIFLFKDQSKGWAPYNIIECRWVLRKIVEEPKCKFSVMIKNSVDHFTVMNILKENNAEIYGDRIDVKSNNTLNCFFHGPMEAEFRANIKRLKYNISAEEFEIIANYIYPKMAAKKTAPETIPDSEILNLLNDDEAKNEHHDETVPEITDEKLLEFGVHVVSEKTHIVSDGRIFFDIDYAKTAQDEIDRALVRTKILYDARVSSETIKMIYFNDTGSDLGTSDILDILNGDKSILTIQQNLYYFEDRPYLGIFKGIILNKRFEKAEVIAIINSLVSIKEASTNINTICNQRDLIETARS